MNAFANCLFIVIGYIYYLKYFRNRISGDKPDRDTVALSVITVIVTAIAGSLTVTYIMTHLYYDQSFADYSQSIDNSKITVFDTIVTYIESIILAPIVEELLFRGIIFGSVRKCNRFLAYVLNIYIFAVMHGTKMHMPVAFASGFVFTVMYEKSGSLKYNTLLHMIHNATVSVLTFIPVPLFVFSPIFIIPPVLVSLVLIILLPFLYNNIQDNSKTNNISKQT